MTVHAANGLELHEPSSDYACSDCRFYDGHLSRCNESRGTPTVGPDWSACPRFLPLGAVGTFRAFVRRNPEPFALAGLAGVLAYPVSLVLR